METPDDTDADAEGQDPDPRPRTDIDRIAEAVAEELIARQSDELMIGVGYSGPLPLPQHFEDYERVEPGAANRILSMAEDVVRHRIWMDRSFVSYRLWGLALAFILALAVFGGGVFLIYEDKDISGAVLIVAEIVALASAFIIREIRKNGS